MFWFMHIHPAFGPTHTQLAQAEVNWSSAEEALMKNKEEEEEEKKKERRPAVCCRTARWQR